MLLTDRHAVVFAATGAIGGAVARRLAAEGAFVAVSGRRKEAAVALAAEITAAGGRAEAAEVDATDPSAIEEWLNALVDQRPVDVIVNAIGLRAAEAGYATPSTALPLAKFLLPLDVIAGSQFATATAAARHMCPRGSGSIVTLSASLSGIAMGYMAGITAACGAIEAMTRSLAGEFGPAGVRVNCVRAGGMPETRTIQETSARMLVALGQGDDEAPPGFEGLALHRPVTLEETAAVVAFLASDTAGGMTAQVVNVCAGQLVG